MAARSWIAIPMPAACAVVATAALPGTRHFYGSFWASFTHESLANRIGILASLLGLFGVPICAAIATLLFWRGREIETLRAYEDDEYLITARYPQRNFRTSASDPKQTFGGVRLNGRCRGYLSTNADQN